MVKNCNRAAFLFVFTKYEKRNVYHIVKTWILAKTKAFKSKCLRGHARENHVVSQNQGRRGSANLNHTGSVHLLA